MRDAYLMQPSVTRNPDELIKAIGRYRRRRQLLKAALPIAFGLTVLALFCAFLLSDAGHNVMVWMDAR